MATKSIISIIVTVSLAVLSFISWIVLTAGVGAFQSWRDDQEYDKPALAVSYDWWATWFALPLIIGSIAAAALKHPAVLVRPLSLLFAVEFTKLTIITDQAYKAREVSDAIPDEADSALGALMAGSIMLAMASLAMTVWLAVLDASTGPEAPGNSTTKEAAAPGHAAAGGQAGGYVVNGPNQAPAGYGYNQGAPGVAAQPDPNAGAYNPTPGAPGMPPGGTLMGAPGAPGAPSPGAPSPGAPPPM